MMSNNNSSRCHQECMQKCKVPQNQTQAQQPTYQKLSSGDESTVHNLLKKLNEDLQQGRQMDVLTDEDVKNLQDKIMLAVNSESGKEGFYGGYGYGGYGGGYGGFPYNYGNLGLSQFYFQNPYNFSPYIWSRPYFDGFGGRNHLDYGNNMFQHNQGGYRGHRDVGGYGHMGNSRAGHGDSSVYSIPGNWARHRTSGGRTVHIFMRDDPNFDSSYGRGRHYAANTHRDARQQGYGHMGGYGHGDNSGYRRNHLGSNYFGHNDGSRYGSHMY